MPQTGASTSTSNQRYRRYRTLLDVLTHQTTFSADAIKTALPDEQPAFITRLIRDLACEGWLSHAEVVRETNDSDTSAAPVYQWNLAKGNFQPETWLDDKLFGNQVRNSPVSDRPRERLLAHGAEALRLSELIAILIRSGRPGESAVQAGEKLARHYESRLDALPSAGRGELRNLSLAVQSTAYCQIMAGIELGRRIAEVSADRAPEQITSADAAVAFCRRCFRRLAESGRQEEFHIVTLDTKNQILATHQITVGTLDASLVHPREVFRPAIADAAASVLLVHNHPSGDTTPSREDRRVTERLQDAGELIGITVLDHIIVGRDNAISLKQTGAM